MNANPATPTATTADAPPARRSARDRLLAAAEELFYEEGVNTVGIDRVIERAGVAKASLYDTFGSKEALIRRTWRRARRPAARASRRASRAFARRGTGCSASSTSWASSSPSRAIAAARSCARAPKRARAAA